jgi:hypothetical protein
LVGNPEGKRHLEDFAVEERIILKWMFKRIGRCIYFRIGSKCGLL